MLREIDFLRELDEAYYLGNPKVTDTEYDKIKSKVQRLYPNDPYFKDTVGAPIVSNEKKVQVPYILGSLEKYRFDSISKWLKRLNPDGIIIVTPKLDGSGIYVEFENGKVTFAGSRGSYEPGDEFSQSVDITEKAKVILPGKYGSDSFHARGEVMLPGDAYRRLKFSGRRTGATGIMNRDDDFGLNEVEIVFHELLNPDLPNEIDRLSFLTNHGLSAPVYVLMKVSEITAEKLTKQLSDFKEMFSEWDLDGLVLTPDNYKREKIARPKFKCAFKVNEDGKEGVIDYIDWNTTRTGKVVPTVVLKNPILIGGANVSRVSAFNAQYVDKEKLGPGAIVSVIRSGDIIPFITDTIKEADVPDIPEKCLSCGYNLEWKGVDLVCKSTNCTNCYEQIEYFLKTLGAENIGLPSIKSLKIGSLEKLYSLTKEDILKVPGFKEAKATMVYEAIQSTLNTTPEKLLAALGIKNVGKKTSRIICESFSFESLPLLKEEDLMSLDGVGKKTAGFFVKEIKIQKENIETLKKAGLSIREPVKKKSKSGKLTGRVFALTGKGPLSRQEIQSLIEKAGGIVSDMGKSTDTLVCADPNSNSSKMKKARDKGVKVISYKELMELLNEIGIK